MCIQLSREQAQIYDKIMAWYANGGANHLCVGGYAGTGKTTLISELVKNFSLPRVRTMSFTGKAVDVLRSKGITNAATIHSTIYNVTLNEEGKYAFDLKDIDEFEDVDLFIVDEASMIPEGLHKHLCSFGIPTLYVGDHGQLPPIQIEGYSSFSLMAAPRYCLTEIHRQALDNPILKIATDIRNNITFVDFNHPSRRTKKIVNFQEAMKDLVHYDQIICCSNNTRVYINNLYRRMKWKDKYSLEDLRKPQVDDKVLCFRNDKFSGIFNGQSFQIENLSEFDTNPSYYVISVRDEVVQDSRVIPGLWVPKKCFSNPKPTEIPYVRKSDSILDYGYAITCHKSQGSEYNNVLVVYEKDFFKRGTTDPRRWLYTAVTRARERLTLTIK